MHPCASWQPLALLLFLSPRLHEVIDVCDKIVVLRDGQVVHETTPAKTNVMEIATHMVGSSIEAAFARDETERSLAGNILKVEHLWWICRRNGA